LFPFALPTTPPPAKGESIAVRDILGLDALTLLKDRSFAVFCIGSLLICIPLAFYYNFTNLFLNEEDIANAAGKMTLGQMSEIFFMLVMPFFFVRLGIKKMLLAGMSAWALRYVLFAMGNPDTLLWMYYLGILLHGICYDFFFVTGQIYVDQVAIRPIRAGAQGLITLITYGLGMLIGAWVSGFIVKMNEHTRNGEVVHHWEIIWLVPAVMAGVIMAGRTGAAFAAQEAFDKAGGPVETWNRPIQTEEFTVGEGMDPVNFSIGVGKVLFKREVQRGLPIGIDRQPMCSPAAFTNASNSDCMTGESMRSSGCHCTVW